MKKLIGRLWVILIAVMLTLPIGVFAAENMQIHILSDLGFEISIPQDYYVITRDTPEDDPVFDSLGTTKQDAIKSLQDAYIYLNAVSKDFHEEIVVINSEGTSDYDYADFNDGVLEIVENSLVQTTENIGITVLEHDIYKNEDSKYIRIYFCDSSETIFGVMYHTCHNGLTLDITFRSYTGEMSEERKSTMDTVVSSIQFAGTEMPQNRTEPFLFLDKDSEVVFTVPANWKQEEFTASKEFLDAKFVSAVDSGKMILYGSTDVYYDFPLAERQKYGRAGMNNSVITKTEIAEMMNVPVQDIQNVTYAGKDYFQFTFTQTAEKYGYSFSVTMTDLVYIENGWIYTFQINTTEEDAAFGELEKLLDTVKYPEIISDTDTNTESFSSYDYGDYQHSSDIFGNDGLDIDRVSAPNAYDPYLYDEGTVKRNMVIIFCIAVLFAASIVVIKIIKRYKRIAEEQVNTREGSIHCIHCYEALPSDSKFCSNCGKKLY